MKKEKTEYIKKEMQYWGIDICNCGHSGNAHEVKCYGVVGPNFFTNCKCKQYRPKDNLVYLEMKYEEKLKHGRRKDKNRS